MGDNEQKAIVTLISPRTAKEGFQFLFNGPTEACSDCRLVGVCLRALEQHRLYKVVGVRETNHPCGIHADGVVTVQVIEPEVEIAVKKRFAVKGANITFEPPVKCDPSCNQLKSVCAPPFLTNGDRLKVTEILGNAQCPIEDDLSLVRVSRILEGESNS